MRLIFALLFVALASLISAAPAPGMDTYELVWPVPVETRDGTAITEEDVWGYDIIHVQIAQNSAPCFDAAIALPDETAEQSQAIYNCFYSERIGEVDFIKIVGATVTQHTGEFAIGETHAWALRAIPMDPENPGQPLDGGSGVEKDDNWSYWSDPGFKTMQFKLGAIATVPLIVN